MSTESNPMRELHEIRVKIYEETKDMTPETRADFINSRVETQLAAYGIKLPRPVPKRTETATR